MNTARLVRGRACAQTLGRRRPSPPLAHHSVFGKWAASGEIDIMEARGQASQASIVEGTLHYGAEWPNNVLRGSGRKSFPFDFSAGFHDFALEWTSSPSTGRPQRMRWLVDGAVFYEQALNVSWRLSAASPYTQDGQPWDQRFHLILNGARRARPRCLRARARARAQCVCVPACVRACACVRRCARVFC